MNTTVTPLAFEEYEPDWWERMLQVLFFILPSLFAGCAAFAAKKKLRQVFYKTREEKEQERQKRELPHIVIRVDQGVAHLKESVDSLSESLSTEPAHSVLSLARPRAWLQSIARGGDQTQQSDRLSQAVAEASGVLALKEEEENASF